MSGDQVLRVKKYSNRRLYDTEESRYITLAELADRVRAGRRVQVVDAKTDADLTRAVLVQAILEEQDRLDILPVELLHQVIRVQGTVQAAPLSQFLAQSYGRWADMSAQWSKTLEPLVAANPFAAMMGLGKAPGRSGTPKSEERAEPPPPPEPEPSGEPAPKPTAPSPKPTAPSPKPATAMDVAAEVAELRAQMEALLGRLGQS
jgi:polyhydroxyalkanoate synthesis repressor PhaR